MRLTLFVFSLFVFLFSSCVDKTEDNFSVEGYRPVYKTEAEAYSIRASPPRAIGTLGKIYIKDSLLFVNERYQGIHVFDNSNPSNPISLKFIEIPGNKDIAIKNNILYADNITDLVSIDISDLNNIREVHRIKEMYNDKLQAPEVAEGYFECVDENKGIPVYWETAFLENPRCSKNFNTFEH